MAAKTELLSSQTLGRIRHIHFVGIGGVGMCGIAEVLLNQGYRVSGSDLHETAVTGQLQKLGAKILLGHKAAYVDNADVVVISSAIKQENPEVVAARDKRIPVVPRAEMLAELMRFRYGIAVAGTHGKTTTTSLMVSILAEAELDPTFVIGGRLNSIGSNARLGTGQYLVAEADESDASFLFLKPMMAIVTNIDADHMETYQGDFARLRETFLQFLQHLPFYGLAALCIDDPVIADILPKVSRPVLTYGFSRQADVYIVDYQPQGIQSVFSVKRMGKAEDLKVTLNLPGRHNVLNAVAAITLATELGVADNAIVAALEKFAGIGRRFQSYGEFDFASGKVLLIDDYGHHPREISSTLEAIRAAWPTRRVVTVFQPHRYSRTKALFEDFTQVLAQTDALLLLEIYAAGEEPIDEINSQTLAANVAAHGKVKPLFIPKHNALRATLAEVLQPGDVLLTQGAGNIGNLAAQLAEDFPAS